MTNAEDMLPAKRTVGIQNCTGNEPAASSSGSDIARATNWNFADVRPLVQVDRAIPSNRCSGGLYGYGVVIKRHPDAC